MLQLAPSQYSDRGRQLSEVHPVSGRRLLADEVSTSPRLEASVHLSLSTVSSSCCTVVLVKLDARLCKSRITDCILVQEHDLERSSYDSSQINIAFYDFNASEVEGRISCITL